MEDEFLTMEEVAKLLKLHVKTIWKLARQGTIPAQRIGRSWRFNRKALLAYLEKT